MYQIMIELAKQVYREDWERNLRRLIRDVLKSESPHNKLTLAEVNKICAEIVREG